jgi:hypothetical protein
MDALSIVMRNHFEATRSQVVELIAQKEISRFTITTTSCQLTIRPPAAAVNAPKAN